MSSKHEGKNKEENAVHPMVPVPDAIRTVLTETSKSILLSSTSSSDTMMERIKVDPSSYSTLMGRILAHDIKVPKPGYPPYDASIMDGYAISSSKNFDSDKTWTHEIVDSVYAGDELDDDGMVKRQQRPSASNHKLPVSPTPSVVPFDEYADHLPKAVYITTGAVVPSHYDAVIPIEECTVSEDKKHLNIRTDPGKIKSGLWIRKVGCDMAADSVILEKGVVLEPVHLGLLVQVGVYEVDVRRLPKVGVLSTGNELLPDGRPPTQTGQIPDANRPILLSKLHTYQNCTPKDLGIATDDDISHLKSTLLSALDSCDVLITTGGISMGEKDIMESMFVGDLGATVHFGRLHMKPGKPTTFLTWKKDNRAETKFIFALPGNPVSATVCTDLVVRPCLDMLHGSFPPSSSCIASVSISSIDYNFEEEVGKVVPAMVDNAIIHPEILAVLPKDFKLDAERPEYHRVILKYIPDRKAGGKHKYEAWSTGVQRSSRLMSCCDADGLLCLPQGKPGKKMKASAGEQYPVLVTRVGGTVAGVTSGVKLVDSMHVSAKLLKVSLIQVTEQNLSSSEAKLEERVANIFGSGMARIVGTNTCKVKEVVPTLTSISASEQIDLVVVVCYTPTFQSNLEVSSALRPLISKFSDAMALQARKGAASTNPLSALFEVLVGFMENGKMLLCLPNGGLEGAISNVSGLLQHAVSVSRGQHGGGGGGGGGGKSHHHHHHHH